MIYFNLWTILWNWKKDGIFSTSEFKLFFPSSYPRKVLFDLYKFGFLQKIKRDQYKVVSPTEIAIKDYQKEIQDGYSLLKEISKEKKLKYALTNVDAITKWTKGAYNADRFFGVYPIHIKVRSQDLKKWKEFFKKKNKDNIISGEKPRGPLFGVFYILYPEKDFKIKFIGEEPAIPLKEAIEFAKKNIATYEHALEIMDKLYGLGLKIKYETYAR
jgi:hypothetical protein